MILLENVSKEYRNQKEAFFALKQINLTISDGEFLAVIGQSGSGKSTLMNLIGMLDTPTEGEIRMDTLCFSKLSKRQRAIYRNKTIGFVFQNYHLLESLTVWKNIELVLIYGGVPKKEREFMIRKALSQVGMSEKVNAYPSELSGGQKQRVAIARAIVMRPKLILADEPSGNLDPENSEKIMELFCNLHQDGHTILMVTHDMAKTHYADKVIRIEHGEIVPVS